MPEPRYELRFTLTDREARDGYAHLSRNVLSGRLFAIVIGVLGGGLLSFLALDLIVRDQQVIVGIAFLCGALLVLLMQLHRAWAIDMVTFNKQRRRGRLDELFREQSLTIGEDGVHAESSVAVTHYRWTSISDIVVEQDLLFLHLSDIQAMIIPSRAFQDNEFEAAVENMRRWNRGTPRRALVCPQCEYELREQATEGCPECGWKRPQHD